ncbi:hypothetical protein AaE_006504 [Aphanomyces astaci]|uniref:DDE Tnp4 domain-containing protein n=1 Tax=Aphanomyces astaci TaxID=112090 RepID=A0A6A5A006_APHAT|nr:hypothetical protein AaE_006504 [Aphanomyces astaci]
MGNIFGFIDCRKFETCRITQKRGRMSADFPDMQRVIYSGHKHSLNFQAVTSPDGLCVQSWGPVKGSRHDTALLRLSKLEAFLDPRRDIFGDYLVYGDPAYGVLEWIFSGYKATHLDDKKSFNSAMSKVRQSVEWSFGIMKKHWSMVGYKMRLNIMLESVGKVIMVAMLFSNSHCCYHGGNQICSYFNLTPPSLEEYLVNDAN